MYNLNEVPEGGLAYGGKKDRSIKLMAVKTKGNKCSREASTFPLAVISQTDRAMDQSGEAYMKSHKESMHCPLPKS
jgi:hypothetical protein